MSFAQFTTITAKKPSEDAIEGLRGSHHPICTKTANADIRYQIGPMLLPSDRERIGRGRPSPTKGQGTGTTLRV